VRGLGELYVSSRLRGGVGGRSREAEKREGTAMVKINRKRALEYTSRDNNYFSNARLQNESAVSRAHQAYSCVVELLLSFIMALIMLSVARKAN
jgi:hypothetical protein